MRRKSLRQKDARTWKGWKKKKGGSLGAQPQYRQNMAETYGRTTKDNVFAEGQLVLKVPH